LEAELERAEEGMGVALGVDYLKLEITDLAVGGNGESFDEGLEA